MSGSPVSACIFSGVSRAYVFRQEPLQVRVIVKRFGASSQKSGTISSTTALPQRSHSASRLFGMTIDTHLAMHQPSTGSRISETDPLPGDALS